MTESAGLRWYRKGTVNVTQGSDMVTGIGSQWQSAGIKPGDVFSLDSLMWYEVVSVNSNTSLTLDMAFQGASGNAQNYKIIRNFAATMQADIAASVANLVNKYESFIDSNLQQIVGPKGDPGIPLMGAWSAGRTYQAMDAVTHTNKLYVAKVSHTSSSNNAPGATGSAWIEFAVTLPEVLDTLYSTRTDAALSAAQGKVLNESKEPRISDWITKTIYVRKNGNDSTGDGSTEKPFASLHRALSSVDHINVVGLYTIVLGAGVYECTARLDICKRTNIIKIITESGQNDVELRLMQKTHDGLLQVRGSLGYIEFHNIKFSIAPGVEQIRGFVSIWASPGTEVEFFDCHFFSNGTNLEDPLPAAIVADCGYLVVNSCKIEGFNKAIQVNGHGRAWIRLTSGSASNVGIASNGALIVVYNSQIVGTVANEQKVAGGQIFR